MGSRSRDKALLRPGFTPLPAPPRPLRDAIEAALQALARWLRLNFSRA